MNKREAEYTTKYIMPWSRQYKRLYPNHIIEAKYVYNYINDADFEPHQLPSLRQAKTGVSLKIADGSGHATPGDIMSVTGRGFIAAIFDDKGWAVIDIETWDNRINQKVSWEDAKEMSLHWYV